MLYMLALPSVLVKQSLHSVGCILVLQGLGYERYGVRGLVRTRSRGFLLSGSAGHVSQYLGCATVFEY
jgi:hypothetical protein